jgi:hypothetical protein
MSILDKLERVLGRFAIRNLSLYLVIGQVFVFLAALLQVLRPEVLDRMFYRAAAFPAGEWWRALTFMFIPPFPSSTMGYVFLAIGWSVFYMMGSALENHWGTFRFNAFLFMSYAITIALSFVVPYSPIANSYILGSVFIAFAYLYPEYEFLLYFILPVKVKWLALLSVAVGAFQFVVGGLAVRMQIIGPVITFFIFFGADILRTIRHGQRTAARRAQREAQAVEPRHVCYVCGKNDLTHPQLDFRYCSKCAGDQCYCPDHIQNHAHVVAPDGPKGK